MSDETELSDFIRQHADRMEQEAGMLLPFPELQSKRLEEVANLRTAAAQLDAYRETFA